jgi:2-polyprenyl-3-methyl-5-hydroxy-6-metoxy-1,4-benzoquinol methylase
MKKFSKEKLEEVAQNSLYNLFPNALTIEYSFEVFKRHINSGSILELGPAEGLMTQNLIKLDPNLYVIEGSSIFAESLKKNLPSVNVINALFEEAELDKKFDTIILGHVLEHVEGPIELLNSIKKWLKPEGIVLCAVPNAYSLHRQAAVEMGLIESVFEMSEKDKHHGHMRIYTPESLKNDFLAAGYSVEHTGGYWIKPLNDKKIEETWTREMLLAFMKLGEKYSDICAEIYLTAKL